MTLFRMCLLAVATIFATSSLAAHADTIDFTISGSAGGFSGSGVLTTMLDGSGNYQITGITATGVTGLIAPGGFNGNDNLLFPSDPSVFDSNGFSFSAANGPDQFDVNVFGNGTGYSAFFRDEDGFTGTLPVSVQVNSSVSAVPEPSTLLLIGTGVLGAAGAIRRKVSS
ncbi:MAG TPA: PEP-CTERM sorting domain-containing protein [Edaphobacter sp.]